MYTVNLNVKVELRADAALWQELTSWAESFNVEHFIRACTYKVDIVTTVHDLKVRVAAVNKNINQVYVPFVKLAPIEVQFTLSENDISILYQIFSYQRGPEILNRLVNELNVRIINARKGLGVHSV